jgi:RNA polymerase sigma-70 factor (ECF subfamily)
MALSLYSSGQHQVHQQRVGTRAMHVNAVAAVMDIALLQRIAKRDQSAVGELYDKHSAFLYTFIIKILKEREEAEDALQEVFLRIWDRANTYDDSLGSPMVWITRIARNLAIDRLRSKLGQTRKSEDDIGLHSELHADEHQSSPEIAAALSQQQQYVAKALNNIPVEQRTLIEYAYFRGYTQSELAEHFKLPLGTVKTRIRTGMASLRRQLEHLA